MHPYEIPYGENQFWEALNRRLIPHVGSLPIKFGTGWYDTFERCFTRSDFYAVAMARANKRRPVTWCVVHLFGEGLRLMDEDDKMSCSSWEKAIGYLAGRCIAVGLWPDSFKLDEERGSVELLLRGEALALIREHGPVTKPPGGQETRAKSTIVGLRDEQDWVLDLHKRMKRWPGLKELGLSKDPTLSEACKHLPLPSEWLRCAKRLGRVAGIASVDTNKAQEIAAAVFDEPSWHHLCALASEGTGALEWEYVSGPWFAGLTANGNDTIESIVSTSPYTAFRSFIELASEEISINQNLEFCAGTCTHNMLRLHVQSPTEAWKSPQTSVDFGKVPVASVDEQLIQKLPISLENGLHACLKALFGAPLPSADWLAERDTLLDRKFLIRDGLWRFSKDSRKMLVAEELDANGFVNQQALIPTYKGGIYWHPELGAHVLTYDYDGKRPVAIMKGIQQKTVDILAHHLHDKVSQREAEYWPLGLSDDDKKALIFLSENGAGNG
jgi:hypothetical protein